MFCAIEILRRQRTSGAGQSRSASAAVFAGISRNKPKDRLTPLLELRMPTSCLTGCVASLCCKSTREKVGDGPRRDHAAVGSADPKECARDVEAVLSSDSYPFFLMPCTAICQITGHRNCGGWETAVYHQCIYPDAFLLPERAMDMYSKESPEEAPAPLKPWFRFLALSLKSTASPLVTGHR